MNEEKSAWLRLSDFDLHALPVRVARVSNPSAGNRPHTRLRNSHSSERLLRSRRRGSHLLTSQKSRPLLSRLTLPQNFLHEHAVASVDGSCRCPLTLVMVGGTAERRSLGEGRRYVSHVSLLEIDSMKSGKDISNRAMALRH